MSIAGKAFATFHWCMLLALLTPPNLAAQKVNLQNMVLNDSTIYLFCRGSKAKSGMISEKFNIQDKNITHVGIGFYENNAIKIYNVTDENPRGQSALVLNDVNSFLNGNVYYFSIWKLKSDKKDLQKLKNICKTFQDSIIGFDYNFNLNDDDKLYCSEFCAKTLKKTNTEKFAYKPTILAIDGFYSALLERSELEYYPVDFFEHDSVKIFEQNIPADN